MTTPTLRRTQHRDRYERHQLGFELTGLALLLAATRSPALVLVPGALLLPATRRTWLRWVREGPGALPTLITALVAAAFAGFGGAVAIAVLSAAMGAIRSTHRASALGQERAE